MATTTLTQESREQVKPTSLIPGPRVFHASLNYYRDPGDGSAPVPVIVGSTQVTNERPTVPLDVDVIDITGNEDGYTLDSHGFQYAAHKSSLTAEQLRDDAIIEEQYYPEIEQLIKDLTGASRATIFNHRVRKGPSNWHSLKNNADKRGPLHKVHIDQSYDGAVMALKHGLPEEAEELLKKKRFQIINVWRPIRTIKKDPLALADARSVPDSDLVAASIFKPGYEGQTWTIKPNPAHRWYFKYQQTPDEIMVFKCFDTETNVARRVPHSAFHDPAEDGEDSRESIETRAFVFYD